MRRFARFSSLLASIAVLSLALLSSVTASAAQPVSIPASLQPWVDWVLEDTDERACPLGRAESRGDGGRLCAWPGRLELVLDSAGGRFEQEWTLYADAWVPLSGGSGTWPQQVSVNGEPVPAVEHDGGPAVRLAAGRHRVSGRFAWPRRPELLPIPAPVGLLALTLDGEAVARPRRDQRGRLWLGGKAQTVASATPDQLMLDVVRRIDDAVPLRVRTRLSLDVSGQSRELTLGPVNLPGGIPLALDSRLPARLIEQAGQGDGSEWMLQVQVRPGRWVLTIDSHHRGPVSTLSLPVHPAPWPQQEVWAFSARPNLRQVSVTGADLIDPRQTRLPEDWQRLPAYLLSADDTLKLTQLHRGSPAADRLTLDRELWLDSSGDGFSLRDRVTGELEQAWRVAAMPVLRLGQVRVDGEPRTITRLEAAGTEGLQGVEVRRDRLDLSADGRFESVPAAGSVALPVSGWDVPMDRAEVRLHLPPGWDLLAVAGVDNLPNSWLARWSLLDIFLVLIVALAVGRLWGWRWGLLAVVALALTWPESGAPRWVWLHVVAGAALLYVLPSDAPAKAFHTLRMLVALYYRAALLVLAVIALPFLVGQVRDGLFPQLERSGSMATAAYRTGASVPLAMEKSIPAPSPAAEASRGAGAFEERIVADAAVAAKGLPTLLPGAVVQTGSGVPSWNWRAFQLTWSGPVVPDEQFRLWLLPPVAALPIALLQVVLVLALGLRLAGRMRSNKRPGAGNALSTAAPMLALAAALLILPSDDAGAETVAESGVPSAASGGSAEPSAAGQRAPGAGAAPQAGDAGDGAAFPPEWLLEQLRQRLLDPPECAPRCIEIPRMVVDATADQLRLLLAVDAAAVAEVPLPGTADGWVPEQLSLNGDLLDLLRIDDDGRFSAPVPEGRHLLVLTGTLPARDQVEIPLPMRPRLVEAQVAPPWRLQGVDPDGQPADQLRLLSEASAPAREAIVPEGPGKLPPLLRVTRTFRLGLDWSLETRAERLSPETAPVSIWVPLVAGEAVTSAGMQVEDGRLLLSLPPGRQQVNWASTLTPVDRLRLTAAEDARLVEVWKLEVSPIWHLGAQGLPMVRQPDGGRWPPTWRPWPGEQLELRLSRPEPVPGPTLTRDGSDYRLNPGRRVTDARLELELRSSQGGRHPVRLPADVELTGVRVDGQPRALAMQGDTLALPLVPGPQRVEISWRSSVGLGGIYRPEGVNLGISGVNARTEVELGRDRWLLWASGPGVGPAVQFWGLVLVLAIAAAVLARSRLTPLGFGSWLLLGVGLSQTGIWAGALVVLWLFALGWRRRLEVELSAVRFNLAQVGLAVLSLAALIALVSAVQQGLLGDPAMQVAGNGSSATQLNWYLDREGPEVEPVTVVSVSIWVYRALMLAWALWLAWRLLDWLRWGWISFSEPTLWKRRSPKPNAKGTSAGTGAAGGARWSAQSEGLTVDL